MTWTLAGKVIAPPIVRDNTDVEISFDEFIMVGEIATTIINTYILLNTHANYAGIRGLLQASHDIYMDNRNSEHSYIRINYNVLQNENSRIIIDAQTVD
jgi:hypothetical protein